MDFAKQISFGSSFSKPCRCQAFALQEGHERKRGNQALCSVSVYLNRRLLSRSSPEDIERTTLRLQIPLEEWPLGEPNSCAFILQV